MPPVLVRLAKRKTTWNGETTPKELLEIEFQNRATGELDLTPSFYFLADGAARLVQAHAEHSASLMDRPPPRCVHVDAQGIDSSAPLHTSGETLFRFTRDEAHREIHFRDRAELEVFISRILADAGTRRLTTSPEELLQYVEGRLDAKDAEWIEACAADEKAKKWPEQVAKMRKRKAAASSSAESSGNALAAEDGSSRK